MKRALLLVLVPLAAAMPACLEAQSAEPLPGWRWQRERSTGVGIQPAADSSWEFDRMPPGWHLTTGPAGFLYPENERASGLFSLAADFVVFPETTDAGFGIFLGGSDLDSDHASFVAALLRRDGALSVVRSARGASTVLLPWTQHPAIKPHPGSGVVTNRLRLHASADSLRIFVNDSAVARLAVGSQSTEGRFGFKVGERVNLHLTILDHIRHLAPPRTK